MGRQTSAIGGCSRDAARRGTPKFRRDLFPAFVWVEWKAGSGGTMQLTQGKEIRKENIARERSEMNGDGRQMHFAIEQGSSAEIAVI